MAPLVRIGVQIEARIAGLLRTLLLVLALLAGPAPAQETAPPQDPAGGSESGDPEASGPAEAAVPASPVLASPIVKLDQERFFRDSAFGKAAFAAAEADTAALAAEIRKLETALEAEERALTDRRATMKPEDFAPLADAFDAKVEDLRSAQEVKSRAISRRLEDERKQYFEAALPVLAELLRDTGAVAILADNAIILSHSAIDVTDEAIARMNQVLPGLPAEPETAPTGPAEPEPAPPGPGGDGDAQLDPLLPPAIPSAVPPAPTPGAAVPQP